MSDNAKESWADVGEKFASWGKRVAERYHDDEPGGDAAKADEAEQELRKGVDKVVDQLTRGVSALGGTFRDEQANRDLADAVRSIGDAITATVEEASDAIRSGSGGKSSDGD